MPERTLKAVVKGIGFYISFECLLHRAENVQDLWMSPVLFYQKYAKKVPEFPHYEMELLTQGVENCKHIHHHKSERDSGKYFCCWTGRIESESDAKDMFLLWSMGAAYSMMTGEYFVPKLQEAGGNIPRFFDLMRKELGASVEFAN